MTETIYVTPPPEYYKGKDVLWRLKKAMYGLKNSPKLWQDHFASTMKELGYTRMKTDPNLYCNKTTGHYVLAYVDDLLMVGPGNTNSTAIAQIQSKLLLKVTGTLSESTPLKFLGRIITYTDNSIHIAMPPDYIDTILQEHGMTTAKSATTTGTSTTKRVNDGDAPLDEEHSLLRRFTGKLLWLSRLRSDIQYATK